MKYYVNLKHPHRIGITIQVVPTGKTRPSFGRGTEAEARVITPQANLDTIWFTKDEIVWKH